MRKVRRSELKPKREQTDAQLLASAALSTRHWQRRLAAERSRERQSRTKD